MSVRRIVVIGASAGGLEAIRALVADLPADFDVPIALVLHTAPQSPGVLHEVLGRSTRLKCVTPRDRTRLEPGVIYVAPPDCHLLVEPGLLRVTRGPRENRFHPAVDPLFRSAAQVFGPLAIGVILTGNLDDGTAGLGTIKRLGGRAIVQDPADALFPGMPQSARDHVNVDHVVPLADIGPLLARLVSADAEETGEHHVPDEINVEVNIAKEENALEAGLAQIAEPSSFACPECHGVLLQLKSEGRIRFRCHTGHAYSMESLVVAVNEAIDESLWNAIRALEEGAMLMQQLSDHAAAHHGPDAAKEFAGRATEAHRRSEAIRRLAREEAVMAAAEKLDPA